MFFEAKEGFVGDDIAGLEIAQVCKGVFHPFFEGQAGAWFAGNTAHAGHVAVDGAGAVAVDDFAGVHWVSFDG